MEIVRDLKKMPEKFKSGIVALGAFDGIHLGHRYLISSAVSKAREDGIASGVFTFIPHPRQFLFPEKPFSILTTWEQREKIFSGLGLDFVFLQKFDRDFAELSCQEFVEKYLVEGLNIKRVFVGRDFRFGKDGEGDVYSLSRMGKELGFNVHIVPPLKVGETVVSSTLIRRKIQEGQVEEVKKFLGDNYTINGKVMAGMGLGRKLGFPTANLKINHPYTLPAQGVYGVKVEFEGKEMKGLAHFGPRPTFSLNNYSFEVYLFDYCGNLYGRNLDVSFLCKIRDIKNFRSAKVLVEQVQRDIKYFKEWLEANRG